MLFALIMLIGASFDCSSSGITEAPASAARFSYDAAEPKGRRKAPAIKHAVEDQLLDRANRSKVQANARDIQRNFAIAAWMIRKHLDYVSTFDFHMRTEDDGLNEHIEWLWEQWSRPQNCDVASRHPLDKIFRLAEARRTVDGDVGLLKLTSGMLQAIESDRIRDPQGQGPFMPQDNGAKWLHGVKVNDVGRALAYAVHSRTGINSYRFERTVSAANLCLFGYFDRFDQVRGVSPILSALNPLRDTYEALEYALLKAKVAQLFAIAFFRQADQSSGELSGGVAADGSEDKSNYVVDFGGGPIKLDLDPGDDVKFLESETPSTQFQDFVQTAVMIALKALDLPFVAFREDFTNFYGARAAWQQYERACQDKWNDARELRRKITIWKLVGWVLDGSIKLKKSQTIDDLWFEHVPRGFPFWDPAKEVNGAVQSIKAGLDNPQRICRSTGSDFKDNIDQIAKANAYAKQKGVTLEFALAPVVVEKAKPEDGADG